MANGCWRVMRICWPLCPNDTSFDKFDLSKEFDDAQRPSVRDHDWSLVVLFGDGNGVEPRQKPTAQPGRTHRPTGKDQCRCSPPGVDSDFFKAILSGSDHPARYSPAERS